MTDINRRTALKSIATSAMAMTAASAAGLPTIALAESAMPAAGSIELEVQYSASGGTDVLVLHNPTTSDLQLKIDFAGDIQIPGGQLDVGRLMQNGPIDIKAGATRSYSLARIEQGESRQFAMQARGHQSLRFPVSDNVYIDRIAIISDDAKLADSAPLLMRRFS